MKADLHVHSTASDGSLVPAALVSLALERRLDVLAIADHDSLEGVPEALEAARGTSLTVVPAVELSASDGEHDVHVLAYFVDPADPALRAQLEDLRAARLRRALLMVEALRDAGYGVTIEQVLELSSGGAVGRSHIAAALVGAGHAATVSDAFRRLIGRDRPFYVRKDARSPRDVVTAIREAGGVAVVAHPGVTHADAILSDLVAAGLGGIEAYHADHTQQQRERYAALAAELGLLTTGGSDFHGPGAPNPPLGSVDVPAESVRAFLAAGAALR